MATIEFSLFAPHNEEVKLVASWNGGPTPMKRGDDGYWRTTADLEDGDYEYQFELISRSPQFEGERVRVGDPTSVRLTAEGCTPLVVRNGRGVATDYTWNDTDVLLPQNHELVIYELHPSDFVGKSGAAITTPTGSATKTSTEKSTEFARMGLNGQEPHSVFLRIIEKLPYLKELGINALQLMPVNDFPGKYNWGYSQNSLYAVEDNYGTPEELCRLIDAAHGLGLRVIHDGVYNHVSNEAILAKIDYPLWFYPEGTNPDKPEMHYGPKFNYMYFDKQLELWPARTYAMGAIQRWAELFHFDGIRFDSTRALRYYGLLQWFHNVTHEKERNKPFITIAEHLPEDAGIAGPDGPMDAAWHLNLFNQLATTVTGKAEGDSQPYSPKAMIRALDYHAQGYVAAVHVVNYLDNHDQDRILWQIQQSGHFDEAAIWRRAKLGATLVLTAPGIPMIRMGEEFGIAEPRQEPSVPTPLDWSLLEKTPNQALWQHYKSLIRLRKENAALCSDSFEVIAEQEERGIFAFRRWSTEEQDKKQGAQSIFVVVNLRDEAAPYVRFHAPSLEDGVWCEFPSGKPFTISDGQFDSTLAPSEARIYLQGSTK